MTEFKFVARYQTATTMCEILSGLGWVVTLISPYFLYNYVRSFELAPLAVMAAMAGVMTGLSMVFTGQMSKALLDNTNANLEILYRLRKVGSEVGRIEPTLQVTERNQ